MTPEEKKEKLSRDKAIAEMEDLQKKWLGALEFGERMKGIEKSQKDTLVVLDQLLGTVQELAGRVRELERARPVYRRRPDTGTGTAAANTDGEVW